MVPCNISLNRFTLVVSSSSFRNPSRLELVQEKATVDTPVALLALDVPDMLVEGTPSECLDFGDFGGGLSKLLELAETSTIF